jgi:hypothetical protein
MKHPGRDNYMKGNSMFKSSNKSKKSQTITVQQQSGQVTPQPIHDIPQSKMAGVVSASHEEIAMRAYEIYVQSGRPQGQSEQIWKQAEQDIRNRSRAVSLSK